MNNQKITIIPVQYADEPWLEVMHSYDYKTMKPLFCDLHQQEAYVKRKTSVPA